MKTNIFAGLWLILGLIIISTAIKRESEKQFHSITIQVYGQTTGFQSSAPIVYDEGNLIFVDTNKKVHKIESGHWTIKEN